MTIQDKQISKQSFKAPTNLVMLLIAIIIILCICVAYLLGKSQPTTTQNSQPSPVVLDTPMITETPSPEPTHKAFDTQACINNAEGIAQNCTNSCTNQANNQLQACPIDTLDNFNNCGNSVKLSNQSCNDNCLSTGKIAINNCRLGISM